MFGKGDAGENLLCVGRGGYLANCLQDWPQSEKDSSLIIVPDLTEQ